MQLEKILEETEDLTIEDKEMLIDIINHRLIEEKRDLIYKNYIDAKEDLKQGNVERGSVKDLLRDIV